MSTDCYDATNKAVWLDKHAESMLLIYEELLPHLGQTEELKNKSRMWQVISEKLQAQGMHYTAAHVCNKWNAIKRYKKKINNVGVQQQKEHSEESDNESSSQDFCRVCQSWQKCSIELTDNVDDTHTYLEYYNFLLKTDLSKEKCIRLCGKCVQRLVIAYRFVLQAEQVEKQIAAINPIVLLEENTEHIEHLELETSDCSEQEKEIILEEEELVAAETVVEQHACTRCDSVFRRKQNLLKHLRKHNDVDVEPAPPLYKCTECERTYETSATYKKHMRLHRGETTPCDVCGKEFICKKDLAVHRRFHNKDFPYVCEFCGQKFACTSHLKQHSLRHKNVRYECPMPMCGKLFLVAGSLYQHYCKHTGQMPFPCCYCSRQYPSLNKYKFHLKKTHNKEPTDEEIEKSRRKCPYDTIERPERILVKLPPCHSTAETKSNPLETQFSQMVKSKRKKSVDMKVQL